MFAWWGKRAMLYGVEEELVSVACGCASEACGQRPVRELEVLSNASFKSVVYSGKWSESLLRTCGTPKRIRSDLVRTRVVTYIYRDIGNLDLYFECPYGKKFPEFFTPKWATLDKMMSLVPLARQDSELIGNGPKGQQKCSDEAGCWWGIFAKVITFGHSCWLLCLSFIRVISVKD